MGTWDKTVNHSSSATVNKASLKIAGSTGGGAWSQANGFYAKPLVKIKQGDQLKIQAWVYAPELKRGELGVQFQFLNGSYDFYNKDHLLADMKPYIDWAKSNKVPLYIGEFGALSTAKGDSRYNLVSDMMSVMNEAGLNWSLWSYRDLGTPYFGLYQDKQLDTRLETVLKTGLK